MTADRLADTELDETNQERNDEKQCQNPSRHSGMENVAKRLSHQYRQVETPHVEAQVLHTLHLSHKLRKEPPAQQSQNQRHDQHRSDIAEHHHTHIEEADIRPLLHHREKCRDDNHRKDIGDDGIGGKRTDTASQLLRDHSHSGCRRTDEADESTLQDQLRIIIAPEEIDGKHHQCRQGSTNQLEYKMPSLRLHLLDLYLAERDIEQAEEHHRHQTDQMRSDGFAKRFQEGNIGKDQIHHRSQYQGARQSKLSKKLPQSHTLFILRRIPSMPNKVIRQEGISYGSIYISS